MIAGLLPHIQRPSRYIGQEIGSVKKDPTAVSFHAALVFPDLYEIGMSHLGLHILYEILNSRPEYAAERAFAPAPDMKSLMEARGVPLVSLESRRPIREFDVIGFTLPSELSYTTVLALVRLAGLPLLSEERRAPLPLIIGGGGGAFNPEPLAPFFDAFFLGEAEEAILEIAEAVMRGKKNGSTKKGLLETLGTIEGIYLPSRGTSSTVRRRIIPDINAIPFPRRPVVPFTRLIHDRWNVEIARGCTLGCRFCQAGIIYRPVRERDPGVVFDGAAAALEHSGWEDMTLLSLSAGDYTCMVPLLKKMMNSWAASKTSLSFPSLRAGSVGPESLKELKRVRKTGFTIAPETGSRRLRSVINKPVSDDDILETARAAFQEGWRAIKLYFMIGLPTETDEDVESILTLSSSVRKMGKNIVGSPAVTVSVGTFVPKPHTPFQWEPMLPLAEAERRLHRIQRGASREGLTMKWHDPRLSSLEALISRGDRTLSSALKEAVDKGCYLDTWSEYVRYDLWDDVLSSLPEGIRQSPYRPREKNDPLPWDHLDTGVTKEFLWEERTRAFMAEPTPDCFRGTCPQCGACDFITVKPRPAATPAVASARTGDGQDQGGRPAWVSRLRLRYHKKGEMRFLGHLELIACLTRALRRAGLPLRYSQGYHPHPKLSFGPALPVGVESEAEYMDVDIEGSFMPEEVRDRVNARLPEGLRILDAHSIPLKGPSIADSIAEDHYIVDLSRLGGTLTADLSGCEGVGDLEGSLFRMTLRKGQEKGRRPQDVLDRVLRLSEEEKRALRIVKVATVMVQR